MCSCAAGFHGATCEVAEVNGCTDVALRESVATALHWVPIDARTALRERCRIAGCTEDALPGDITCSPAHAALLRRSISKSIRGRGPSGGGDCILGDVEQFQGPTEAAHGPLCLYILTVFTSQCM